MMDRDIVADACSVLANIIKPLGRTLLLCLLGGVIALAFAEISPLSAQEEAAQASDSVIEVSASAQPNPVLIGDVLELRVEIEHDSNVALAPPAVESPLGKFEVREQTPPQSEELPSGRVEQAFSYMLSIYETGAFEIPSLSFGYSMPDNATGAVATDPISVTVSSVLPPETESDSLAIRDLKPQQTIEGVSYLWVVFVALAALLALIAMIWWLRDWLKKKPKPEAPAEVIPPDEQARAALEALRNDQSIFQPPDVDAFSVRVSEIIRTYLQEVFHFHALDLTSGEILAELGRIGLPSTLIERYRSFFEACDLVKFARQEMAVEGMYQLLDQAGALITETQPHTQAQPESEPQDSAGETA